LGVSLPQGLFCFYFSDFRIPRILRSTLLCYSLAAVEEGHSMRQINFEMIKLAVDITKAAVTPVGTGMHHIGSPDAVAKFLEIVANKLEDLRIGPAPR